jgi:hypothetical protein
LSSALQKVTVTTEYLDNLLAIAYDHMNACTSVGTGKMSPLVFMELGSKLFETPNPEVHDMLEVIEALREAPYPSSSVVLLTE